MRNLLYLLCLLYLFTGCDMNLTETVLLNNGEGDAQLHPSPARVSQIPEAIKELIWQDYETLRTQLLSLHAHDTARADELLIRIRTRQEQEEYYTKYVDVGGIAIIGADTLSDTSMLEAQRITAIMTAKRPELRKKLTPEQGFYFILTDLEWTRGYVKTLPDFPVWDLTIGGGAPVRINIGMCLHVDGKFICTAPAGKRVQVQETEFHKECREFWCETRSWRKWWDDFTHEMAHAVEHAAQQIDPNFHRDLIQAYNNAKANNLWRKFEQGQYAMTNYKEYWAVASTYWFYGHRGRIRPSDPNMYKLLAKWYPLAEPFSEKLLDQPAFL